jgi:copper homeostasis protein
MNLILECIAFTLQDCVTAQGAGANRIELCDNAAEGGTTPSSGFINKAREILQIELYTMIRPRGGDFLYTEEDYQMMKHDITICKNAGCDGIVLGALMADGNIDKLNCSRLIEYAYPLGVTFHRAFDRSVDPFLALEDVIEIGCERILTSGHKPKAEEGIDLIGELIKAAQDKIVIMPGSGVRKDNIKMLREQTNASEFHAAPRTMQKSKMVFINPEMKEPDEYLTIYGEDIKAMRSILNGFNG